MGLGRKPLQSKTTALYAQQEQQILQTVRRYALSRRHALRRAPEAQEQGGTTTLNMLKQEIFDNGAPVSNTSRNIYQDSKGDDDAYYNAWVFQN